MTTTIEDYETHMAAVPHHGEVLDPFLKLKGGQEEQQFIHGDDSSSVSFEHMENYIKESDGSHMVFECDLNHEFSYWNSFNDPISLEEKVDCSYQIAATMSSFGSLSGGTTKEHTDQHHYWMYSGNNVNVNVNHHQSGSPAEASIGFKRQNYLEEIIQPSKKQRGRSSSSTSCDSSGRKNRPKASSSSKDPQSLAAKNRRERISERLKTLQELIPNGTKVDLVTMLEKAIGYVKFLQLQVKVLATDEFWPIEGKTPSIAQVREAIDTILNSQNDKTSSSSK